MTLTIPTRPVRCLILALGLTMAAGGCGGDSGDPLARSVHLVPEAVNGSAVVHLLGAEVTAVTSDEGEIFFSGNGDTTRVVLLRNDPGPIRFDVRVADPGALPIGVAVQVADSGNHLRPNPAVYRVEVVR